MAGVDGRVGLPYGRIGELTAAAWQLPMLAAIEPSRGKQPTHGPEAPQRSTAKRAAQRTCRGHRGRPCPLPCPCPSPYPPA